MARIRTNVIGKVRNIKLDDDNGIMALHEAIVNSIHSIDDAKRSDGEVTIEIRRNQSETSHVNGLLPVQDIKVTDNGIGFTKKNYTSFQTAESTHKLKLGGKGIGRFLWLKVFDHAEIKSIYKEYIDQKLHQRSFEFVLDNRNPIVSEYTAPLVETDTRDTYSSIKLCGLRPEYIEGLSSPLSELADSIIEHHIHFLVDASCPKITLRELPLGSAPEFNLNWRFNKEFLLDRDADSFELERYTFEIAFLKIRSESTKPRHSILYSADKRVVVSHPLVNLIPNLNQPLRYENGELFDIFVLVSSSYFDQHVNRERTELDIPVKTKTKKTLGKPMLSLEEIQQVVLDTTYDHLESYLTDIRREKDAQFRHFVNTKAPQYRALLNHQDKLDKIKPGLSDERLDIELHKVRNELIIESREAVNKILESTSDTEPSTSDFTKLVNTISDVSQSNLVDYVLQRKLILRLFERALQRRNDGKYELEEQIHKIIFPMRKTSDEVDYEEHNLWLIDERLAYHRFLHSDKPLDAKDDNSPRPDIVLGFDQGLLYTDSESTPYDAFTIIEFKRPMRQGYVEDADPIAQVQGYLAQIQNGDATTQDGRPITPTDGTKYYCYIICDLTRKIRGFADSRGFTKSPDNQGYFWYNPNYRAYIELISFDKLVKDSKQRNQILFDKLGIGNS